MEYRVRKLLIGILGTTIVASSLLVVITSLTDAHGTCADHQYRVYRGEPGYSRSHDRDNDGVGCESLPEPPHRRSSSGTSSSGGASTGYDRDNWDYNSGAARARLGCDSSEHVDHVVALKEAYDSGASRWTNALKSAFANDPLNQWCLDASVNTSKSDGDLAEWSGGTCEQRKYIARVTIQVKAKYSLSIDPAEANANTVALNATCSSGDTQASRSSNADSSAGTGEGESSGGSAETGGSSVGGDESTQAVDVPAPVELRIAARPQKDGRIEFAVRLEDGELVAPRARFLPASPPIGRWLVSSPISIDGTEVGKIRARRLANGRTEFGFIDASGDPIFPRARFLSASARIERWAVSTPFEVEG